MMSFFSNSQKSFNNVGTQTDMTNKDLDNILNTREVSKYRSDFHREYYLDIKNEIGTLPSDRDIDRNKWYYYKYMNPSYSDKIIHIYSIGRIGNGSNLACVYCKQKGHIKSKCPVAKKENLGFTFNF